MSGSTALRLRNFWWDKSSYSRDRGLPWYWSLFELYWYFRYKYP